MAHPIYEANENSPYGSLGREQFYKKLKVHQERFMTNEQNMNIFTQSWQPADSTYKLKGLIGMIHGYTSESSWLFELSAMAKSGFFVCALDLQGHGFSDGPPDPIPDIHPLVCDCIDYFNSARADHPNLPPFLYGESLGAALAILVCLKQKTAWKGLVLSGAMCEFQSSNPSGLLRSYFLLLLSLHPLGGLRLHHLRQVGHTRRNGRESWSRGVQIAGHVGSQQQPLDCSQFSGFRLSAIEEDFMES